MGVKKGEIMKMERPIIVRNSCTGEDRQLAVKSGATLSDIRSSLRLGSNFKFFRTDCSEVLGEQSDVLGLIKENQRLELVPQIAVAEGGPAMKRVTVTVAESGDYRDLNVAPGTTPRDIRAEMGLDSIYRLSVHRSEVYFDDLEDIFEKISDGTKLVASTAVEVGYGSGSRKAATSVNFPGKVGGPSSVVRRSPADFLKQKGWMRWADGSIRGPLKAGICSAHGKIVQHPGGKVEIFVRNPNLLAMRGHKHEACFWEKSGGWYFVHHHGAKTVEGAFIAVEQVLKDMARSYASGSRAPRRKKFNFLGFEF